MIAYFSSLLAQMGSTLSVVVKIILCTYGVHITIFTSLHLHVVIEMISGKESKVSSTSCWMFECWHHLHKDFASSCSVYRELNWFDSALFTLIFIMTKFIGAWILGVFSMLTNGIGYQSICAWKQCHSRVWQIFKPTCPSDNSFQDPLVQMHIKNVLLYLI